MGVPLSASIRRIAGDRKVRGRKRLVRPPPLARCCTGR
jgi:hypothetical protein